MATKYKTQKSFKPGRGYVKQDWDAVSDNPPVTRETARQGGPLKEVLPDVYESIQRSRGRPKSDDPKQPVTVRIPQSVLERWKRDPEWRAHMAEALEKAAP